MCAYQPWLKGILERPQNAEHFNPLNLGRLFFDKKLKVYGVALETDIERGVVTKLSRIADNVGAVIRFIQVSMVEADVPSAKAIAFLDFSDSNVAPEEALDIVKKQKFVKHAHIIYPSHNGVLYDEYFFPLIVGHERAIVFDKTVYESLFKGLRKEFGSAGEAILYYQGFNVGYNTISPLQKIAGSEDIEILIELVKVYTRVLGWGIVDNVKIDLKRGRAKIRLSHSFECEIGKGFGKPYSQFCRGFIAGIFSKIFVKNAAAREVKCIAKGDSYCEFLVKI